MATITDYIKEEEEKFHKFINGNEYLLKDKNGFYKRQRVQTLWEGWLARATLEYMTKNTKTEAVCSA